MQILSTKLSIPPVRTRLVQRPRLIQKLNQGLDCGLMLISAPAGYGKTTLLTTWLSRSECATSWLSLDDSDNDPARFLTYLKEAFNRIEPSIEKANNPLPGFDPHADIEAYLIPFINFLAQVDHPLCLILDDYHTIQNQIVHQAVSFLLEHRPEPLHLVILTRADPPLPLAKLRARCDMVEIRMADLRFTNQEAADFLNHTMGLKISPEDAARITQRTEGWIAGLQLAALSMQTTHDIPGFINSLSGSHHYIFDYLIEEILEGQTPEIQRFLLYTSILDQFHAPLCDTLLDRAEGLPPSRPSSTVLEELEHANLFIIPLDHEQRWYRYHPLFTDLLRGYLQKKNPELLPTLHTQASTWFEEQGLIPNAIQHAFLARDWNNVIRLISTNIFALLEQSELNNVARQIESLSNEESSARPWLLIGRAWLAAYTGQLSSVEPILKLAEAQIGNLNSELELQTLGGHIAAIRAYANWIGNNREISVSAARAALEWLPETERLIRCQAATVLGLNLVDLNEREIVLKQALAYAREIGVSHVTIFAHGCWAWSLVMQGRLHEAHAACLEAVRLAQTSNTPKSLPTLSHVYTTLSSILCEWDDLEGALFYSREAVLLARHWEQADALHFALDNLGNVLFVSGDVAGAFEVLQQAWRVARQTSTWFEDITISRQVDWHIAQGNLEAAQDRLRSSHVDFEQAFNVPLSSIKSLLVYLSVVQLYIAQKDFSKALALSQTLIQYMEKWNIGYYFIHALKWQALAYQGLKQDSQALATLKRALTLAAPEGYKRTFLHPQPGMVILLRQALSARILPGYVGFLLAAYERDDKDRPVQTVTVTGLVEPLTEREMDVLKQLEQGCSDKKIAENLVIARETVHKHLKNIYGKLDVHSRTEAIARAHELRLL